MASFSPHLVRRVWIALLGAVLVTGDIPARIAGPLIDRHGQSIAFAEDGDGGDGDEGDSDGGDNDGADADSDGADADTGDDGDDGDDSDDPGDDADDEAQAATGQSEQHRAASPVTRQQFSRSSARSIFLAKQARSELVAFGLDEQTLARLAASGYTVVRRLHSDALGGTLVKLRVPPRTTLEAARRDLASRTPRSAVDFNHYYRPDQENAQGCSGARCFATELIGWPLTPTQTAHCGTGIRIGLIDTAINEDHATFYGRHMEVIRLDRAAELPESSRQHGTAVVSLLLGAAESRSPGLLPGSEVIAVDAFHRTDAGDERADVFDVVRALDVLSKRNVQAVNMSFSGPPNQLLEHAIARLAARNIVLVAAAGNKGPHAPPLYPAAYPDVMAVTAVDHSKTVYRHANQGDYIDFAAPGVDVWTAASLRGARPKTGTSFAAPFVTAVAAVVAVQNPTEPPDAVQERMASAAEDLGNPGRDPVFGWGLVNARDICAAQTGNATN